MKSALMKSKSRYLIHFFLVFLSGIFFVLVFLPKPTLGIADCCPISSGEAFCRDPYLCSNNILECCYPGCPYENWTSTGDMSACQANLGSPNNVCCGSVGCSTPCGDKPPWTWCYADDCQKRADPNVSGACQYRYKYTYDSCGATDTCVDTKYLKAGLCDIGGCSKGGFYKICCEVNASGNFTGNICPHVCSGTNYTGVCGSGCNPVIGSSCPASPSPTPGGPTPTPTPTPPPDWGSCWCRDPVANYCNLECCWGTASDCPGKVAAPTNCCEGNGPAECEDVDWIQPPNEQSCPGGTTPNLLSFPNANLGFETGGFPPWEVEYGPATVGGCNWTFCPPQEGNYILRDSVSNDEFRVDQRISGLTPGKTYLVSVWGRARSYKPDSDNPCLAKNQPQIKLISGSNVNSWVYISRARYTWNEQVRGITVPPGVDWIEIQLRSDCICDCWGWCYQSAMDWVRIYECTPPTPPPSCTLSLSPSSITIQMGETSPLVANVTVQNGSTSRVDFSSSNTGVATVNPASDTTYVYSTTVTAVNAGSATLTGTAFVSGAGGNSQCSGNAPITVTPPDPWFQTQGGDVHGQTGISSPVIQGEYFCKVADGFPGVVSYGSGDYDFQAGTEKGEDRVSPDPFGWLANSSYIPPFDYQYFYKKLDSPTTDNFKDSNGRRYCDEVACPTPAGTTIYYVDGDLNIQHNSNWAVPATSKIVVLIKGNLNIKLTGNRKITVAQGGFLGLIVNGNINIDGNIGDKQVAVTPYLEGVYLAVGDTSIIDTYEPDPADPGLGSGRRLVGAGLFYARSGFNLQRDLKDDCSDLSLVCNARNPAELFIFRPDLVLNAPRELWVSKMSWLEVAP